MEFNKLVFAGLAAGCLAAAAGGSYLAVRQNQAAPALVDGRQPRPDAAPAAATTSTSAAKPVTESEGVITPEAATPAAPAVEPAAPTRPAPRVVNAPPNRRASTTPTRSSVRDNVQEPSTVARAAQAPASAPPAAASNAGSMWETRPSVQPSTPEYTRETEPVTPPPPPAPEYVEVTVPSDSVLGLQIERTVSSEIARTEDKVEARVTRDVRVNNRIAIPAGSTVRGSVTEVDRGGRMKGKARLAVRFHTIVLADGTELALKTDPVVREGQSPAGETTAKVGGAAIGGAILGAILGGGKGAATGAAIGAASGTAAAMSNDRNPATLNAGTTVTVRMQAPVTVTVQKD